MQNKNFYLQFYETCVNKYIKSSYVHAGVS